MKTFADLLQKGDRKVIDNLLLLKVPEPVKVKIMELYDSHLSENPMFPEYGLKKSGLKSLSLRQRMRSGATFWKTVIQNGQLQKLGGITNLDTGQMPAENLSRTGNRKCIRIGLKTKINLETMDKNNQVQVTSQASGLPMIHGGKPADLVHAVPMAELMRQNQANENEILKEISLSVSSVRMRCKSI